MKEHLYLFSGLGADERAFAKLDLNAFSVTHIKWIQPIVNENIKAYATRLLPQITTANPILVGLSFGGMMAVEVAKQIATKQIILIASAKGRKEIPFYFRWSGALGLYRFMPYSKMKKADAVSCFLFGAKTEEDKKLLAAILADTDIDFLKWAIDKIVNWKNETMHPNLTHIHGTADQILPYRFVQCDYPIGGGGHLMTLNRAPEISALLAQIVEVEKS